MRALRPLVIVAAGLLLAGCIVGDPPKRPTPEVTSPTPEPIEGEAEPVPPRVNVSVFNGSVMGARVPGVAYVSPSENHIFALDVPDAPKAIIIEMAWTTSEALSLHVDVPATYCSSTDPLGFLTSCPSPPPNEEGRSPARVEITDPDALQRIGTWQLAAWTHAAATEVPFTIYATVFYDAPPPSGYTAVAV